MNPNIASIIDRLGGLTALARELGHQNPTTVQGWKDRGVIPLRHIASVIEVGRRKSVALSLEDFVPIAKSKRRAA